ncbi:uncharacterized protein LOC117653000 isoform X2 [Thrips palmi]|nr:uncharacterized protein LOC117653000 isoform X2 [Thrips palmi]
MLKIWCDEFLATVSRLSPKLVALHCQEVGGKNYERSMQHVSEFVKLLMSSEELQLFDKVRIFLDEDYSSAEHFTALGNFYFIHESLREENIQIFNFQECKFESVAGKEVFSGNIEDVVTKEKSKFPQETFPECKWSRKGFMRTRWNLNGTIFDLVNIHLFHDASNFIAMESCPSVYCKNRQRALDHTLKRFHTDHYGIVPFFVFGDFNFRTDTQGVVKKLSEGLNAVKIQSNKSSDPAKLQYRDESSQQVVLTLGKKEFSHQDHQKLFVGDESEWLRAYDRELESFSGQLFEFTINFPPTYPYVEDSERGEMYMQTRCPSWCDRVFLSASARALVDDSLEDSTPEYGLIGLNSCMGDHKPVFLQASLIGGLGTVSCCALPAAPCTSCLSATSPLEHVCRLCTKQPVDSSSFPVFEPEQDHSGLVVPKFHRHTSPYTPDSTDTEPDLGEELSPEDPLYMKTKNDRRLNRSDVSSRKRLHISADAASNVEGGENLNRAATNRKSVSKIPVRVPDPKEPIVVPPGPIVSKIPVSKHAVARQESLLRGKNGTHISPSTPSSKDNLDKRLTFKLDNDLFSFDRDTSPMSGADDHISISKPRLMEGRKQLFRQMNVDEESSDSDTCLEDSFNLSDLKTGHKLPEDTKVEIQFSLVETSSDLSSPVDGETDGFLSAKAGGSTTDSGVSISPDLSGAASPSTDETDKVAPETASLAEYAEDSDSKAEMNASLDRFTFVRRIQSASAMERKSSFPFPSSIFVENQPSLTGFGGSGSDLWGMRTCRCMSDGSRRQRSSTISHSMLSSRTDSRIRLISTSSRLDRSLPRLQSHHSSSDEDWFEEIATDPLELPIDNEQIACCDSVSRVQTGDCVKRLSTHQECINDKLSELGEENAAGNDKDEISEVGPESFLKMHSSSQSQSSSDWAMAAVGKTLAQTCFVQAVAGRSVNEEARLSDLSEAKTNLDQLQGSESEKSTLKGKDEEVVPLHQAGSDSEESPKHVVEIPQNQRRLSVTSNVKATNSRSCKACCTLL